MKVLLVNGSPNKNGCTNRALLEVEKTLNEEGIDTEIFWIGKNNKGGCIACGFCAKNGRCVFDDAVNEFRQKAYEADGFIFGSPVHYASIGGNMSSFMDRLFYSELVGNDNKAFCLKPAASVVSARRGGTTAAFDQMNKYLTMQEMPVVSSRYWNMVHGHTPQEVENDLEGLSVMRMLGRNMAYMLKCKQAAKDAGVELPKAEERVFTNFIR